MIVAQSVILWFTLLVVFVLWRLLKVLEVLNAAARAASDELVKAAEDGQRIADRLEGAVGRTTVIRECDLVPVSWERK